LFPCPIFKQILKLQEPIEAFENPGFGMADSAQSKYGLYAGQNLSPDEMVQLMKEYRRLMSEGWTLEQINDYFDIDPDMSLII